MNNPRLAQHKRHSVGFRPTLYVRRDWTFYVAMLFKILVVLITVVCVSAFFAELFFALVGVSAHV